MAVSHRQPNTNSKKCADGVGALDGYEAGVARAKTGPRHGIQISTASKRSAWGSRSRIYFKTQGDFCSRVFLAWTPLPAWATAEIEDGILDSKDRRKQKARCAELSSLAQAELEVPGSLGMSTAKFRVNRDPGQTFSRRAGQLTAEG
jgi:hypothetical protein